MGLSFHYAHRSHICCISLNQPTLDKWDRTYVSGSNFFVSAHKLSHPTSSHQLHLEKPSSLVPLSQSHLGALLKDLADIERLLKDVDLLSGLARLLPKGACIGRMSASPTNMTWPLNTTTWGPNTTDVPREEVEEEAEGGGIGAGRGEGKEEAENPHSQFSAFVQLWAGLQPILCGNNRWVRQQGGWNPKMKRWHNPISGHYAKHEHVRFNNIRINIKFESYKSCQIITACYVKTIH